MIMVDFKCRKCGERHIDKVLQDAITIDADNLRELEFRFSCGNCEQGYAVSFEKPEFYYTYTIKTSHKEI